MVSILYERLSGAPHVAEALDRHAPAPDVPALHPPSRSHSGGYLHQDMGARHPPIESERSISDYPLTHDRPRVISGHDARSISAMASMGPGVVASPHISGMHTSPRRNSSGVHDPLRHLHMPTLSSVPHIDPSRSHSHSQSQVSPILHHSHSNSSHQRPRSPPSSRSRARHPSGQPYIPGHPHPQHYPESVPLGQHIMHSPPMIERERSKHHDAHELPSIHGEPHGNGRHSGYPPHHSPSMHPSEVRSSTRVHGHQRMGPTTYMNRDEHYDRQQRELEREREWERERELRERNRDFGRGRDISGSHILSPPSAHRSRPPVDRGDYPEHHVSSRIREDQIYYRDPLPAPGAYPMQSRSGTPGSGSGSGIGASEGPSRPDSRPHYYDAEQRTRSYRLRPVNQPNEEMDFVHEDGRSSRDRGGSFALPEQSRSSMDSRKRGRNDMEADSDDVGEGPVHSRSEDRGTKRYHREHRRSVDNLEDARLGPS